MDQITPLVIVAALGLLTPVLKSLWEERRERRRKWRVIACALIPDLIEIRCATMCLGNPTKWDSVEFPPHGWSKYRDDLSYLSNKREWATISDVFEGLADITHEAERHEWPDELSDLDVERLDRLYQRVRQALDILHRYAGTHKPPRRVRHIRLRHRLRSLRLT